MLAQTEATWREAGRRGPVIGVSSLQGEEVSFPNTTDVDELVEWTRDLDKVTVFATYASLGLGTLERAHKAGLPGWDLIVVDEAHRTSGRLGKPWTVVHDNTRVPALRRLYVTATPRLWQLGDDEAAGAPGELVVSMDDDPAGPFGSRAYTLTLSEAIDRGICAPYQVVCADTQLQAAQLLGAEARSVQVRRARLAGLQTALLKASSEEGFRRTLVFHHQEREAGAFAAGLPGAAKLHAAAPRAVPEDDLGRLVVRRPQTAPPAPGPRRVRRRRRHGRHGRGEGLPGVSEGPRGRHRHPQLRLRLLLRRTRLHARPRPGRRAVAFPADNRRACRIARAYVASVRPRPGGNEHAQTAQTPQAWPGSVTP
ncbi:hypothetical protein ACFUVQ_00025 [Streptomyces rochei]|uniref:hypothetical protein n=1 Tax=Streptomyces rochei TaxID=1928 RepID=UPI003627F8C2